MQTKLPPLFVLDAPNGKALVASNPALTEAQAALVIDIVEVRYPRLVELLESFPGFTDDATVGDLWAEKLRSLLQRYEV